MSRAEIDDATDRAVRVDEAEGSLGHEDLVGGDVGVVVEGDREAGGGVDDVEADGVAAGRGPGVLG